MGFFGKIREIIGVSEKKEPAQQMRNVVEHVTVQPAPVQQTTPTIPQVQTQTDNTLRQPRRKPLPIVYGEQPHVDGVIKDYGGGGVQVLPQCFRRKSTPHQSRDILSMPILV